MSSSHLDQLWKRRGLTDSPEPALYLDTVTATDFAQAYKKRTYALMSIRPNNIVLDVGCGTGEDVIAMARLVGSCGQVIGIDKNPAMVAEGWKRADGLGLPVRFQVEDSHRLSLADNMCHAVRSDRAVQHMDDPEAAIREMVRVTRPNGIVMISEPDWETLTVDSANRHLTRRIANFMADRAVKHGWIGRQLWRILKESGLEEVKVTAFPFIITDYTTADRIWGLQRHARQACEHAVISESERLAWHNELCERDREKHFFSSTVGFLAFGRKPLISTFHDCPSH
jgi:ubiquinone/menaquinone biosynthesis C-methylase UbiE